MEHCRNRARVLVVNDGYRLAPWADALYACDGKWWAWHPQALQFAGMKITNSEKFAAAAALHHIEIVKDGKGLSADPSRIHGGQNGGYQAINLAYLFGATRIVMIGYDMRHVGGQSHWFGDHPDKMRGENKYRGWIEHYKTIAAQLPALGIEIINCTPNSALRCFPMRKLQEVLA